MDQGPVCRRHLGRGIPIPRPTGQCWWEGLLFISVCVIFYSFSTKPSVHCLS